MNVRRTLVVLASLGPSPWSASRPDTRSRPSQPKMRRPPLTNLAHLDWLGDTVDPPDQAALHTTYRLAEEPEIGVLWTYAEPRNGVLTRVGGGTYDPATDTYGQGAFNADDVSRAAVVYIRHWVATGSPSSRDAAYQMLRGLTYLQTASGDNAGNVVLWMQPDGTLNPSAEPVELPDPSDSDASYWVARTIWALGEGYAAFAATDDPADEAFAGFLRERLELSIDAVDRQVLDTYGQLVSVDGRPTPSWLIADGADASAEAVLGLAAYVEAGGSDAARTALEPARRRHRPALGRDHPQLALRRGVPVGPVPVAVARLGLADAGGPRPRVTGAGHRDLPRPGRQGLRRLHAVAAHVGRPGQRPAAHAARPVADRLRRRLARPVAAGDRRGNGQGRPAPAGRHAGGLVLRRQRGRCPGVRPGHRTDDRRHLRRRRRQLQLGRRVDDPRAAHDARARRQPRRGGGRPGGDHHGAGRDDDGAGGGRQHDRRRTRRHPGGPVDGRVALRRDGLPRPGRRARPPRCPCPARTWTAW